MDSVIYSYFATELMQPDKNILKIKSSIQADTRMHAPTDSNHVYPRKQKYQTNENIILLHVCKVKIVWW